MEKGTLYCVSRKNLKPPPITGPPRMLLPCHSVHALHLLKLEPAATAAGLKPYAPGNWVSHDLPLSPSTSLANSRLAQMRGISRTQITTRTQLQRRLGSDTVSCSFCSVEKLLEEGRRRFGARNSWRSSHHSSEELTPSESPALGNLSALTLAIENPILSQCRIPGLALVFFSTKKKTTVFLHFFCILLKHVPFCLSVPYVKNIRSCRRISSSQVSLSELSSV